MIILDTHAWLWMTTEPARLSAAAKAAVDSADRIGVCTISCWEVGMLVGAGRIRIDRDPLHWMRQALATDRVEAVPLTAEAAMSAALLPKTFPGDPADRIIHATATSLGVSLVTRDTGIRSFDAQRTIW